MGNSSQKVFVVFNPKAGKEGQADEVRAALARHFIPPQWTPEIYETTGKEDVAALCRAACERGASLVIAVGGDGTLVGVANGLVHSPVPLGILPLGTGNNLARALLIPLKLDEAVELLVSDHAVMEVDALQVGERHFFSNVSVGISSEMAKDTKSANKKLFGRLAYALAMVKRSSIFKLQWYTLTLDGQPQSLRAAEVMISNTTLLDKPLFLFGPPETLSDGQLEVYVVTARHLGDYMRLVWDLFSRPGKPGAKLSHWTVKQSARIDAIRRSPLVQADGEVIGHTPVEIKLVPKAIHVIMPKPA
ncbi:MAG: diacylglycerol kinase family lipid kinase [Candidatus Eisenbacteria bacterium]|nr:diacylglycerol kinase family lipid kinase [Candidatus Eisenbacteria bacterium]